MYARVVGPALESMKPETRIDFLLDMLPRFSKFALISALTTIGAGIVLLGWVSGVDTSLLPTGIGFLLLLSGAVLAFVGLLIGMTLVTSSTNKLLKLLQRTKANAQEATSPEVNAMMLEAQRNIRTGANALSAILPVVMALMILSLYA